jgi:predicted DsbA family dithiol-disulfide isomerase
MIDPAIMNIAHSDDTLSVATLRVDIIADLICPWCFLGKRRLDNALQSVHGPSVVNWFPFQLNPNMPDGGMEFDEYLESKFGNTETIQPGLDYLSEAGKEEGIRFRFDRIKRVPQTLYAHQLMILADKEGADTSSLADRILRGFFEEGLDIADRDVLLMLGAENDLSADAINKALDDDSVRQRVLGLEAQVRKGGVTGVPDFLINRRLFILGAQKTEVLVDVFDRAMFGEDSNQLVSRTLN